MKTKEVITRIIEQLISKYDLDVKKNEKKVHQKYNKQMIELKELLMYVETKPSEELIQKQITQLKNEIKLLELRYSNWACMRRAFNEPSSKQSYRNAFHIPLKEKQIKQLKFILG